MVIAVIVDELVVELGEEGKNSPPFEEENDAREFIVEETRVVIFLTLGVCGLVPWNQTRRHERFQVQTGHPRDLLFRFFSFGNL